MEEKIKNEKSYNNGITLIALIITIIVMLILVGVTVSIAINKGLFKNANQAKENTQRAAKVEKQLSNGRVKIDGVWYDSLEKYLTGDKSLNQTDEIDDGWIGSTLPTYENAKKKSDGSGILEENAMYESDGYTATIPKGFKISEEPEEKAIGKGLVILDSNGNEFVWIPLKENETMINPYPSSTQNEPKLLTDIDDTSGYAKDSQEQLDYYYGKNYYVYDANAYSKEYTEMVNKVNQYRGFYIGRYETTIDGTSIGSKKDKKVIVANDILKTGNNTSADGTKVSEEPFYYRWYGLYYASKDSNVTGNKIDVQTAMIYEQLWDRTMEFIREQKGKNTEYDVDTLHEDWHKISTGSMKNAGTTTYGDVALNIWDLESNGKEWTQGANYSITRSTCGGSYYFPAKASYYDNHEPASNDPFNCSRLILYIKN